MKKQIFLVTNFIHVATKEDELQHFNTNDIDSYELLDYAAAEWLALKHNMAMYSIFELHSMTDEITALEFLGMEELCLVTNFVHVITKSGEVKLFDVDKINEYELIDFPKADKIARSHDMGVFSLTEIKDIIKNRNQKTNFFNLFLGSNNFGSRPS
jgi:hypothetical protein